MTTATLSVWQKTREFVWPIHGKEHKKFLPMTAMIGLILFNYTVLRNIKDSLVVTNAGAETITFLKVWAVVPSAIVFFFIFSKLSNILSKKALFYTVITPFLVFFALFAIVLYPNREFLHPTTSADWLQSVLPHGFHGVIAMYRFWTYSVFYTLAELWGSAVLSLTFWQLANDVTRVQEAKRFYAHFYFLGNLTVIAAGYVTHYFSSIGERLPEGVDAWQVSLNYLITAVCIAGMGVLGLYYYLNRYVFTDPEMVKPAGEGSKKKSKPKMSMGESMRFLLQSKYLGLMTIIVLAYGISINLCEVSFKNAVHLQYPTEAGYNGFMGLLYMVMGTATFVTILIGSAIVRFLGWRKGALATPVMMGLSGGLFFAFMIFQESLTPITSVLGATPLMLAVMFGFAQNILAKSTKYALFDPTKEMAYIPLDEESKSKGKAAIDVVGGRLGKSGGAFIQQAMFIFIGPLSVIGPYIAVCLMAIVGIWIAAVYALDKRFTALTEEQEDEEAANEVSLVGSASTTQGNKDEERVAG